MARVLERQCSLIPFASANDEAISVFLPGWFWQDICKHAPQGFQDRFEGGEENELSAKKSGRGQAKFDTYPVFPECAGVGAEKGQGE